MGPSMSTGTSLTQKEAKREALAISISERYSLLEEKRPVIEIMAYNDKYKKILDGICLDKIKLDGMSKEEEEAIIKIKGEALIEKDDPGAFMIPIRLEERVGQRGSTKCKKGNYDVEPLKGKAYGASKQCSVPAKTSLDTAESDNDDEEEYAFQRNKFGAPIYGTKPARYLNCNDPLDHSLALQEVLNPFRKICVWKKVVSFLRSLPVALQHVEWKPDYTGCFNKKEDSDGQLWEHTMMKPDHQEPNALDNTKPWRKYCSHRFIMNFWNGKVATEMRSQEWGCGEEIDGMLRINLCEAGTNEEIFISVAWIRAFNINEPIYSELCHEFYSTYEFDEVCADDELKTKKIIKFRLGGRAHRGLRSDEHFNAQEYWLSISREENLSLSRSHASTIRILMKRKGAGTQRERERESLIYCGQFITKLARKVRVLSDEVLRSLSAPIYCRDLDTTMLRELIDSEGRLILRFHSRMYLGLLSRDLKEHRCRTCTRGWIHMVGVYNVPLRGAYNPPGYDQQQYDQYYQQYPPQQQQ
ncbi:hypothetical protein Tco_0938795 [Tanacetum coccineum]|uniref:Uncharacterized protein n=1 Tax=Tanacetum coccineum TaxID=301880 RepID=A0ABQ5DI68_9ASTR